MTRNLDPDSAASVSRRSAIGRLAGASAAGAVAAAGLGMSRAAARTARSLESASVVTTQEESPMTAATPGATPAGASLTVVLVHGAFADSSGWNGVIERLQAAGVPVTAAVNPLRGVRHDSAYVASFLNQIPGPVLVVAHSYGG